MSYWDRITRERIARRRLLKSGAALSLGAAALALVGCGGDDDDDDGGPAPTTAAGGAQPTATSAAGAGTSSGIGSAQGYAIPGTGLAKIDHKSGKPGGTLVTQTLSDPSSLRLVSGNAERLGSYSHSRLLLPTMGYPGYGIGTDPGPKEPELAETLPEIPDEQTYIFTLRKGVKFHDGQPLTAQDVVYSFDRNMNFEKSINKRWFKLFYEKAEAVDDYTVKLTTHRPYVDTLNVVSWYVFALNQAWEESEAANTRLMGTGPFKFKEAPGGSVVFERNPEYFDQPFPYFDGIRVLGTADDAKKLADWATGQTHVTYWVGEELRDQMAKSRPDGICFCYFYPTPTMYVRTDQAPFTDKRVRQALMMSVDRDKFREVATKGEGEADQFLSWTLGLGFRKPAELGASAKFWTHDLAEAKKLLEAAGVQAPIKTQMWHWNNTVVGQQYVDSALFIQQHLREQGIAEFEDHETTYPQSSEGWISGKYDGTAWFVGDGGGFVYINGYGWLENAFGWPADFPSNNRSHIDDVKIRDGIAAAVQEFDDEKRLSILAGLEDTLADEQYILTFSTRSDNFFLDPTVKNAVIPLANFGSSVPWAKKWWFDKG